MSFIRGQFKEIRRGGLPLLIKKMLALPAWFDNSRYGLTVKKYCYGLTTLLFPCSSTAHYKLGKSLFGLRQHQAAVKQLNKATGLKPGHAAAHACLAETLIVLNRFDEALTAWEKAFELRPDWPEVHSRIQNGFYLCGRISEVQRVTQQVIDFKNEYARKHQLDILGMRFLREFHISIGHIALLDLYVKMGILGRRSPTRPVLLAPSRIANRCYLEYWRPYLPDIVTDPAVAALFSPAAYYLEDHILAVMDSAGQQTFSFYERERAVQEQWELEGRHPLLVLKDSDNERGRDCLKRLGVPADAWFVGLHAREGKKGARDTADADIHTYCKAIESIVARGGWVIRMGNPTMTILPPMPQVIDYAHSDARCDWMDVFLWARCRFFIGTQSGPQLVPPSFGVPCVLTNWSSPEMRMWFRQNLQILKLRYSNTENRYLTFTEVASSTPGWAESSEYLGSLGIELKDNTPEEIKDVVVEMMDRLDGKVSYSKEDEHLQAKFDNLFIGDARRLVCRTGRDFLRKWAYLL